MSKVSIIVPVYNNAKNLRKCLDSLINQTIRDIEIICIDDYSTDDSLAVILQYSQRDSRIKVIRQEINKGLNAARNLGIENAQGEFVAFVNADDFVDLDFYEKLYNASEGYDLVKGEIWDYVPIINKCSLSDYRDFKDTNDDFMNAIYRKLFIDKYAFNFPEGITQYEGLFFSITVSIGLPKIKVVDNARLFHRVGSQKESDANLSQGKKDFFYPILDLLGSLYQSDLSFEIKYGIVNEIFTLSSILAADGKLKNEEFHCIKKKCFSFIESKKDTGKIKVSVVVPVYNGEKYLRRTLDCLTLQSLYEIEIICVNDCSQDDSLNILKEYQEDDARIKIIDCQQNGGESKARNIGIRLARGEYIAFMDHDDRIDLLFYEKLYEKAIETKADIVKGNAVEISYNGKASLTDNYEVGQTPLHFIGYWWTAIYNKSLILDNNIELLEGYSLGGDLWFQFDACRLCNKVVIVPGVFYYHCMHADSGDSEITPLIKIKSILDIGSYILDEIEHDDLFKRDKDCYVHYYIIYIYNVFLRIKRCRVLEGKLLCVDFIFKYFNCCKCRDEVLTEIKALDLLLAYMLKSNKKDFFCAMLKNDSLSTVFYENKKNEEISFIPCTVFVPYVDKEAVGKYIVNNAFLKEERSMHLCLVDNSEKNKPISIVYNDFLDMYDYSNESWFIFIHSDFEFLSFPSKILNHLDKSKIYGPVGAKAYIDKGKIINLGKGSCIEKDHDNTLYYNFHYRYQDLSVDTLDCMCLIVHSSLIKKYHLRFDEKLLFDLYVEDFCINANRQYGIPINAIDFDCAHHSSYVSEKYYRDSYLRQLEYVNKKYPNDVYGGTVTTIGGKMLPSMNIREFGRYKMRQELITGKRF